MPHSARPSVVRSVESLLATNLIGKIIVVTTEVPTYLNDLRRHSEVAVVRSPMARFCKAAMLNHGVSLVESGLVLTSDADIVWSADGLGEILAAVEGGDCDFAWLDTIIESEPSAIGTTPHRRLGFRVVHDGPGVASVELFDDDGPAHARPGYGMLCGMRASFARVGGYKIGWGGGWGWEDVDIILRAGLLGLKLAARGTAVHLTHDDALRALAGTSRAASRDGNVALSRRDICDGRLLGALAESDETGALQVRWHDAFFEEARCS